MTLDNIRLENYQTFILPFLKNGIVVDTCVVREFIHGFIETRIARKRLDPLSEFEQINVVFDLLHVTQKWSRLYVTPHVLTEICRYLENTFNGRKDYKEVVHEIFPILEGMSEYAVSKIDFCKQIDQSKPVIEAGDISIFVTTEDFINKREKIAILTKDGRIRDRYESTPNVLVMDYRTIAYNMV